LHRRLGAPGHRLATTLVALELDHVLIAVSDLTAAGRDLDARHGLASIQGGRHPGWGTANRIVPLGEAYLELVAVVDEAEAAQSPFGTWVARAQPTFARPLGWAVRTDRLDEIAARHGLPVTEGSRRTPDGAILQWRVAGIEHAAAEPSLPFLIEWASGTPRPGRAHPAGSVERFELARLELTGDDARLSAWLGPHELPITVQAGRPAVTRIVLATDAGEVVLQ
jgi:glyoxalase-like protein